MRRVFPQAILIFCLFTNLALAGTTGKIAGRVYDKKTGEPLPGANIIILGTTLGAASNVDGRYFILQVPPGRYRVKASMMGYQSLVQEDVSVSIDRTTQLDFALEPVVLELGKTITVTAERPMVALDVTASAKHLSTTEVKNIPNVVSFEDVVAIQPGAVGSGRNIHIRGGRAGEVMYLVDGIPIRDPISGYSALDVDINSIKEIEILTGGYNAEYGSAQSAVVNIVTKGGTQRYRGEVIYKTDNHGLGRGFNSDYGYLSFSGPEPILSHLLSLLGVSKPKITFFASASGNLTDTYLQMKARYPQNRFLGLRYNDRQRNRYTGTFKLIWDLSRDLRLRLGHRISENRYKDFDWRWIYLPDSTNYNRRTTNHTTITLTHTLSSKTFYVLNLGYIDSRFKANVHGLTPPDCWHWVYTYDDTTGEKIDSTYVGRAWGFDNDRDGFVDEGLHQYWSDDRSRVWTLKLDLTSQVHHSHQIKTGVEINRKKVEYVNIQYGGAFYFPGRDTIPGPFPEYGLYRWVFDEIPYDGAFYIQDKMEYQGLIINAGVRVDFFSPGKRVESSDYVRQWEKVTGMPIKIDRLRTYLSPRLGLGFPVTDKAKLYFSYGHFTQMPDLQYLYRDPWTGTWVGNPNLKPQINIAYEFGIAYQFSSVTALDVKLFTKDISGYPGLFVTGSPPVWVWINKGYASTRGVEVELRKRYSHYTSGVINYTYMISRGYASDSFMEYYRGATTPPPVRENRLNWDRNHSINLNLEFYVPPGQGPRLFGLKMDNWGFNLLWKWGTGLPYTPFRPGGRFTLVENTATAPSVSTVDLKVYKDFKLFGMNYSLFVEVLNLLNNKNVSHYYGFNTATGKPYRYGDANPAEGRIYDWREMKFMRDPRAFSAPRQVFLGIKLWW